jgi:hypothetical protein
LLQEIFRDARAAEKARARQRFRQRLRLVSKASLFVPFDYLRLAGPAGSVVKERLES